MKHLQRAIIGQGGFWFGDGSDGALDTTGDVTLPVTNEDTDVIVKNYTNVTINSGHILTTDKRCRALIIFCKGNLTVTGTISMTAKGAKLTSGNNIYLTDKGTYYMASSPVDAGDTLIYSDSHGGDGGDALYSSYEEGYGGAGSAYSNPFAGGFGGGGAGSVPGYNRAPGDGGDAPSLGSSFLETTFRAECQCATGYSNSDSSVGTNGSGGSGGCGSVYSSIQSTYPTTVRGRSGYAGLSNGAGGGGSGGNSNVNQYYGPYSNTYGEDGNDGQGSGGFVLLIVKGTVTINSGGKIEANGGSGGNGGRGIRKTQSSTPSYSYTGGCGNAAGGGGAGGGMVLIWHKSGYTNNGSVTVSGGSGGDPGATGSPYWNSGGYAGDAGTVGRTVISSI